METFIEDQSIKVTWACNVGKGVRRYHTREIDVKPDKTKTRELGIAGIYEGYGSKGLQPAGFSYFRL